MWVAVGESHAIRSDIFDVVVMTGELIISREKFRSLLDVSTTKFYVELLDLQLDDNVLGFLNLSSARNFGKRNFHWRNFSQAGV